MKTAENIVAWMQGRMKQAMAWHDAGYIPAWLLMTIHLTWWTIAFIFIIALQPYVKIYTAIEKRKEERTGAVNGN